MPLEMREWIEWHYLIVNLARRKQKEEKISTEQVMSIALNVDLKSLLKRPK